MDIAVLNIPASALVDYARFAEITIEKWEFNIGRYKKVDTGNLINSFAFTVAQDAKNNTALISFTFNYYIRMIEMGVGKYVPYGEWQNMKEGKKRGKYRKPFPVFSKTFYAELMKLGELLTKQYAIEGAAIVANEFTHGTKEETTFKL